MREERKMERKTENRIGPHRVHVLRGPSPPDLSWNYHGHCLHLRDASETQESQDQKTFSFVKRESRKGKEGRKERKVQDLIVFPTKKLRDTEGRILEFVLDHFDEFKWKG